MDKKNEFDWDTTKIKSMKEYFGEAVSNSSIEEKIDGLKMDLSEVSTPLEEKPKVVGLKMDLSKVSTPLKENTIEGINFNTNKVSNIKSIKELSEKEQITISKLEKINFESAQAYKNYLLVSYEIGKTPVSYEVLVEEAKANFAVGTLLGLNNPLVFNFKDTMNDMYPNVPVIVDKKYEASKKLFRDIISEQIKENLVENSIIELINYKELFKKTNIDSVNFLDFKESLNKTLNKIDYIGNIDNIEEIKNSFEENKIKIDLYLQLQEIHGLSKELQIEPKSLADYVDKNVSENYMNIINTVIEKVNDSKVVDMRDKKVINKEKKKRADISGMDI